MTKRNLRLTPPLVVRLRPTDQMAVTILKDAFGTATTTETLQTSLQVTLTMIQSLMATNNLTTYVDFRAWYHQQRATQVVYPEVADASTPST